MKLFFVCVSVKRFAFRQCQLAHCLLLKMRSAALLSLLSYTLHDFAMFVSCFFILSGFITVVFCIFQYSIWKWINCSHFFFFCHHLPISQFLLLIHFLISWVFVIKYILREKLSVLYSLRSFFLKYVCFYLHDTMPGKIFFSPNFFTSELCFTFLHQFSGTGYCCGEECDANLSLFFFFCTWFGPLPLKIFQAQQVNQKFPGAETSLSNYSHQNLRCHYHSPVFGSPEK